MYSARRRTPRTTATSPIPTCRRWRWGRRGWRGCARACRNCRSTACAGTASPTGCRPPRRRNWSRSARCASSWTRRPMGRSSAAWRASGRGGWRRGSSSSAGRGSPTSEARRSRGWASRRRNSRRSWRCATPATSARARATTSSGCSATRRTAARTLARWPNRAGGSPSAMTPHSTSGASGRSPRTPGPPPTCAPASRPRSGGSSAR